MTLKARDARIIHLFKDEHLSPSQIDKELNLPLETARRVIVDWWITLGPSLSEFDHEYED